MPHETRETGSPKGSVRELLTLAWPLILSQSLLTLQILVDRVLLAWTGGEAVGASMAGAMLFWTPISFLMNTANYATAFVAQYTGAKQPERVGPVVWQSLYFSLAGGLAFLLLIPFAPPLFAFVGHNDALQHLEIRYFQCLCLAALPTLVSASIGCFFAGRGDSRTVLLINVVGLSVNVICAATWIYGLFGYPSIGIVGAGWATVMGATTSALLSVGLYLRPRYRAIYRTWAGRSFDAALFLRLMRFGVPNGVFLALDTMGFTLFLVFVGRIGSVELAATSIAFSLNLIVFLPVMGFGQAVEVLVGQRLGENRPDLAAASTWQGLAVALSVTLAIGLIYLFLPEPLASLFRSDRPDVRWEEVGPLVVVLMRFVVVYCVFDTTNLVFSFALRGAGDMRFVTWVAVSFAWPVMILPTWAAWRYGWGLYWAWSFASLYIMSLALTFCWRFRQGKWRSMRVIEMKVPDLVVADTVIARDAAADYSERNNYVGGPLP